MLIEEDSDLFLYSPGMNKTKNRKWVKHFLFSYNWYEGGRKCCFQIYKLKML